MAAPGQPVVAQQEEVGVAGAEEEESRDVGRPPVSPDAPPLSWPRPPLPGRARLTERPRLSVVLPLGPGEAAEGPLLDQLRALPAGWEVVLCRVEGAPPREPPPGWPASVTLRQVESLRGRALQMNAGARAARGEWLWFLHADTRLAPGALPALLAFLGRGEEALGWFDLAFHDGPRLARLNAWGANLRSARLGLPFGDQGLVLPAAAFSRLGGYDEAVPSGEDHRLVWSARRAGLPLRRVGAVIATSARRYEARGWARTTARHLALTASQAWRGWRGA